MRGDVVLLTRSEVEARSPRWQRSSPDEGRRLPYLVDSRFPTCPASLQTLERPRGNARESRVSPPPAQPGAPLDSCVA